MKQQRAPQRPHRNWGKCSVQGLTVGHVTCSAERPQEGSGGDGGGLEVDGEEGEDSLDQEGSRGSEALRGSVPSRGQ